MKEDDRPDPEALLARAHEEDRASSRGRLKIFFGAAAGVGKTYAMLEAAHERLAAGVDVVVGHLDTHGRPETEALRAGLPELASKKIEYRERALAEFDLDAALNRNAHLLLVDELAHTNVPGSRHASRYQDVEELLHAGIDVYTTLNVQHLESYNDLVARITGVVVRETVPDSVLESADEVEIVDLPPDELLIRFREGKVYVPSQAEQAMKSFFRKSNLIALRELALRCTADRVDAQMQVYRRAEAGERTWPIAEKILVCVSPSPTADTVVRAGRRLARRLRAEWVALFVEQPRHGDLPRSEQEYAVRALRLAEQLGAEAVTLSAHDAVEEILSFARARNVSRIVIGKPARYFWLRELLGGSFVERLARRSGEIDVFIVSASRGNATVRPAPTAVQPSRRGMEYVGSAIVVAFATALALWMSRHFEPASLIMVYLLGVTVVSARWSRGPSLLAAFFSVAAFDFFFVPPHFSFAVSDYQYILTFAVMAAVAVLISTLTGRIRDQAQSARQRERRTAGLYSLSRDLASTRRLDAMASAVKRRVEEIFEGSAAVYVAGADGRLEVRPAAEASFAADPNESSVAQWTHDHSTPAGWGTSTLAGAEALHLPLVGSRGPVGVLAVRLPWARRSIDTDRMHLLEAFANQAALALERALLAREAHRHRLAAESENLRNAILAAVSHDLRTPLAAISGAASSLAFGGDRLDAASRRELVLTIHEESDRMARLANDLLDMARLQSRNVVLRREWQHLEETVGAALEQLQSQLGDREVVLRLPEDLPLVPMDEVLIERVLVNLLGNAIRYTPEGTAIELAASAGEGVVTVEVLDRGPGLAPGEESRIFEKFFRGEAARSRRGIGLGLAVAQSIVEAHGGRIWVENRAGGGAAFRFTLPLPGEPPDPADVPRETEEQA